MNDQETVHAIDSRLSNRFIKLDPFGYFLIKIDAVAGELVIEHYPNNVDDQGRAIDPDTGKVLLCGSPSPKAANLVLRGRSAKELGIKLTEGEGPHPISQLDHALYLGRELQKAEVCLIKGETYIQD